MIIDCAMPDQSPWERVTPPTRATAVATLTARLKTKITELTKETNRMDTRMYDPRTGQTIDLATGAVVGSIELAVGAPGPIGRLPRHAGAWAEQGHYGRLPETDWQSRYEPADDGWGPITAPRSDRSGRPIPEPGTDPEPLLAPPPSDETIADLIALARNTPYLLPSLADLSDHEIARKLITARMPMAAAEDPTILDAQPAVGMPQPGSDQLTRYDPITGPEEAMQAEQYRRDYGL